MAKQTHEARPTFAIGTPVTVRKEYLTVEGRWATLGTYEWQGTVVGPRKENGYVTVLPPDSTPLKLYENIYPRTLDTSPHMGRIEGELTTCRHVVESLGGVALEANS